MEGECAVCYQKIPKDRIHYGGVSCYSCRWGGTFYILIVMSEQKGSTSVLVYYVLFYTDVY